MIQKFKQFVTENQLFGFGDKILLAVSGGPDSVVLAYLAHSIGLDFGISHVNFQLRGADSDSDEAFVRNLAQSYGVPLHIMRADTNEYASSHGLSIEMAARELRYNEFNRIMDSCGYKFTAVAHHIDDAIETFFLNLTRGSGIKGLTGMRLKNGRIVRPMLCFSRKEIESCISDNNLGFRIDKTNLETDYTRNKIRNIIIPEFEKINPAFRQNAALSLKYLGQAKELYVNEIEKYKQQVLRPTAGGYVLCIADIEKFAEPECLVYEIFSEFGFNRAQARGIYKSLGGESGRVYMSDSHKVLKDRDTLIVSKLTRESGFAPVEISAVDIIKGEKAVGEAHLKFQILEPGEFSPTRDSNVAYYDYDRLEFPLTVREWESGDTFVPFGASYSKKLSDYFVDSKLTINEKHSVKLLCCAQKIIWIVGRRASNLYKVGRQTKKILKVTVN